MPTVAIVGASGLVGESLIKQLNRLYIDVQYLLFGNRSSGQSITICNKKHIIKDINSITSFAIDYAIFMSNEDIASQYIPQLVNNGTVCIDNSRYYRLHDDVPLVIDSINGDTIGNSKIIANPNCTTIQLAMVLNGIKRYGIERVVCSTYQAVSGGGRDALTDWHNHSQYGSLKSMLHPIADNIIPHIDTFDSQGITAEEHKVINETRKILQMPNLAISCLAVRVPVSVGHCISANIQLSDNASIADIRNAIASTHNCILLDNPSKNIYPMPIIARDTPYVYVGRITQDYSRDNCYNCFVVADNLIRGASINAIEILQHLLSRRTL